jgi:hypothetical protein
MGTSNMGIEECRYGCSRRRPVAVSRCLRDDDLRDDDFTR